MTDIATNSKEKKKVWVVSGRRGEELMSPSVFDKKSDAEKHAKSLILESAKELYEWETGKTASLHESELADWAEDNGYVLSDCFFWDGTCEAIETMVTEHTI